MITVVINGQNYNYPEVGDTDWGSIATLAFDAITKTTLQPVKDLNDPSVVNDFTLYNDIDFGPTHGLRVLFIQSRSNNPAASGVFRLAKDELVAWRNEDNDGDNTISFDADGDLIVNGVKVTLHGQIVNDDIAAGAGIEESKLALDYSTDSLHTAIEDKAISNLKDTNINTPYNKQALMYDGNTSKWINRLIVLDDVSDTIVSNPNPGDILLYDGVRWSNEQNSVDALTDATVLNPADGDVLVYNSNSWQNSDKLTTVSSTLTTVSSTVTTHVADKNNPHETSLSNLKDTTISTPSNGDALTFDGTKWVNTPSTSSSLSGLSDTDITTPTSGDTLVYNNVTTKWENSDELSTVSSTVSSHVGNTSNPHSTHVANLTDISLSGLNYGDRLTYDSGTSTWFNQPNTLGALIDTGISSEQNGDALVYDGVQWVNEANTVENLKDVTVSSIADKDTLLYDSNSAGWINAENSVENLSNTDIDSNTLTENDVLVFNDQTLKWENSQIMVNHIGNTANPHLTTVAKLTDTAITTPANKDVLYYDYANSQWINYPIASAVNNLWSASTSYSLGDIVNYAGRTYKCAVAHTSSSVFEADFYGGKWDDGNIAGTIIQNLAFGSSVPYHYFDVTGTDAGAEISQATYPNLYAVIGGTYDTCYDYVNGTQYSAVASGNFRLPDFRNTFFKNSGSSTWGLGHNAEHKHTTALDSATDLSHLHYYTDSYQNSGVHVPAAYSTYLHFYRKYMNTQQDDTLYTPSINANQYTVSYNVSTTNLTVPAIAMQNQGSGITPEPNNYGTRIFIKY